MLADMAKTYEMLWDCESCGTKKLLGKTHRHCPSCGSPQDPARRYFPSDAEKVAVEDHVFAGADRICPACQAPASAAAQHCGGCGAPLVAAKEAAKREDQVGQSFAGETVADAKQAEAERKAAATGAKSGKEGKGRTPKAPKNKKRRAIISVSIASAVLLALFFAIGWTKEQQVRVVGHSWSRAIDIESFGPVSDSSWCDSMPGGAYRVSRSREVRSHRQVADGQECSTRRRDNGDGTFSESEQCHTKYKSEPVYDDRCRYTIDRWHHERTVATSGTSPSEPRAWPPVRLARTGTCMGCEREGAHREAYEIKLTEIKKGSEHSCKYPEAKWAGIASGSAWLMDIGVLTSYADCDSLKPAP